MVLMHENQGNMCSCRSVVGAGVGCGKVHFVEATAQRRVGGPLYRPLGTTRTQSKSMFVFEPYGCGHGC